MGTDPKPGKVCGPGFTNHARHGPGSCNEGPGEKRAHSCTRAEHQRDALQVCPLLLGNRECPHYDGLDFQPRGLRAKAISTWNWRAWHFEQRSRVQACLSVTFQPRMLASERGSISRSWRHLRQLTQIT